MVFPTFLLLLCFLPHLFQDFARPRHLDMQNIPSLMRAIKRLGLANSCQRIHVERLGARTEGCTAHTANPILQRDHTRPLVALKICMCYARRADRRVLHMRASNVQQQELSSVCWLPFISTRLLTSVTHKSITYIKAAFCVIQKQQNFTGVTAGTNTVAASFEELVIITETLLLAEAWFLPSLWQLHLIVKRLAPIEKRGKWLLFDFYTEYRKPAINALWLKYQRSPKQL